VDQIVQERLSSPLTSHIPSISQEQSGAEQPLNNVSIGFKPLHVNTLPGIVVRLSVLLTLSFVVLILSTLAGLQLGNTLLHPSPFAAFEAIWPGQSVTSLSAYAGRNARDSLPCIAASAPQSQYIGLDVQVAPVAYNGSAQAVMTCADYPKDDIFRTVSVTIENNRIRQLEFYSDVLPEDSLLLYWGMPDSITQSGNPQIVNLYWERSTYSVLASVMKSGSVVKLITVTAKE
jgi:hypothetical protein